jgi:hypothetical protein
VNKATGLLTIGALSGLAGYDWDYYDGAKTGAVTAFNAIYYRALLDGAYVADGLGYQDVAVDYRRQAAELAAAINKQLYNPATGVYDISVRNGARLPRTRMRSRFSTESHRKIECR